LWEISDPIQGVKVKKSKVNVPMRLRQRGAGANKKKGPTEWGKSSEAPEGGKIVGKGYAAKGEGNAKFLKNYEKGKSVATVPFHSNSIGTEVGVKKKKRVNRNTA